MKKLLVVFISLFAIALCWYHFILDEKDRILWSISSDKVKDLYNFENSPFEFDEYNIFLSMDKKDQELEDLFLINEKWTNENNGVSMEIILHSIFYQHSPETYHENLMEQDVFLKEMLEKFETVNVLNQKGYYPKRSFDNAFQNPKEAIYTDYEALLFDLDEISYQLSITRNSSSSSLDSLGADKLIDIFFTNNFK